MVPIAERLPDGLRVALAIAVLSCAVLAAGYEPPAGPAWTDATPTEIELPPSPPDLAVFPIPPLWEPESCALPFVRQLQRHPGWMLRIDANNVRHCGMSPERRLASIELTAAGATWRGDGRIRHDDAKPWSGARVPQQLVLTPAELQRLRAALDAMCELYSADNWTRSWFSIALDGSSDPVSHLQHHSVGEDRLETLFGELQTRYNTEREYVARGLRVDLLRAPYEYIGWQDYRLTVRDGQRTTVSRAVDARGRGIRHSELDVTRKDAIDPDEAILLADCLASLPYESDVPAAVIGTARIDGVQLPIRIGEKMLDDSVCLRMIGIPLDHY